MKRNRFTEEQIIGILKEHEAGVSVADLCRKHGVSDASIYKWKAKFGGMDVSKARLEDENTKLKRLLADATAQALDILRSTRSSTFPERPSPRLIGSAVPP